MSNLFPAKKAAIKFLASRVAAAQGLETKVFDNWQPELDEVLQSLPETDIFPHELFSLLMKMADPKKRKIILVMERGVPVALAGLRDRWGYWEPVTQWIVPGVLFPVKEGFLERVLTALSLPIRVAWWRWETRPPQNFWIRNAISTSTHGVTCKEDFESYWKKSKNFRKNIRLYRKRCQDFDFKVDMAGSAEWTIRKSEEKWREPGAKETADLSERLLVAKYLQKKRLHHTLSLIDKDEIIAGITYIVHRDDAVAHVNYRDPKYDNFGVMNRLMELSFFWAKEMDFKKIDIGGSAGYKAKWAPEAGEKWEFDVNPFYLILEKPTWHLIRKAWVKATERFKSVVQVS